VPNEVKYGNLEFADKVVGAMITEADSKVLVACLADYPISEDLAEKRWRVWMAATRQVVGLRGPGCATASLRRYLDTYISGLRCPRDWLDDGIRKKIWTADDVQRAYGWALDRMRDHEIPAYESMASLRATREDRLWKIVVLGCILSIAERA
jgi:hypothetical protein